MGLSIFFIGRTDIDRLILAHFNEVFTTSHNVDTTNTLTNELKALLIVNCLFQCITRQIIDVQRIGSRIHRAYFDLFQQAFTVASPPALFA